MDVVGLEQDALQMNIVGIAFAARLAGSPLQVGNRGG